MPTLQLTMLPAWTCTMARFKRAVITIIIILSIIQRNFLGVTVDWIKLFPTPPTNRSSIVQRNPWLSGDNPNNQVTRVLLLPILAILLYYEQLMPQWIQSTRIIIDNGIQMTNDIIRSARPRLELVQLLGWWTCLFITPKARPKIKSEWGIVVHSKINNVDGLR